MESPPIYVHAGAEDRYVMRAEPHPPSAIEKELHMNTENQELANMIKPIRTRSMLAGLLVGGLIGAGTMLLFAPQPGAKTRAELQQGAIRLRDRTNETVKGTVTQVKTRANQIKEDVQIKVKDIQHQGRDVLGRQLDRISHIADVGKKRIENTEIPTAG